MSTSPAPHSLGAGLSGPGRAGSRSTALLIALGGVEIAFGLIAIVWPAVASVSIAILLGCLFFVEGGVVLVSAFFARGWQVLGRLVWDFLAGGLRTAWSGLELRREKRGPGIREGALSRA
jgi:uncharacterized membrane protein HdeD (DUF308 family)